MNISDAFRGLLSPEELTRLTTSLGVTERDTLAGSAIETVTSGALSVVTRTSLVSVTGTQAYTLADGTYAGQRKTLKCSVAASTPAGTVTPAHMTGGTSILLDAVTEWVELEWHTGGWVVVALVGATIS